MQLLTCYSSRTLLQDRRIVSIKVQYKKSYVLYRVVTLPVTLGDPEPVKAIFSEGFTETLCTGVYFRWMDSLKMQEQYSIFSEGFTETMGTEIYFQW